MAKVEEFHVVCSKKKPINRVDGIKTQISSPKRKIIPIKTFGRYHLVIAVAMIPIV